MLSRCCHGYERASLRSASRPPSGRGCLAAPGGAAPFAPLGAVLLTTARCEKRKASGWQQAAGFVLKARWAEQIDYRWLPLRAECMRKQGRRQQQAAPSQLQGRRATQAFGTAASVPSRSATRVRKAFRCPPPLGSESVTLAETKRLAPAGLTRLPERESTLVWRQLTLAWWWPTDMGGRRTPDLSARRGLGRR